MSSSTETALRRMGIPVLLAASMACCGQPGLCEESFEEGDRFRITLLEAYNQSSTLAQWNPQLAEGRTDCEQTLAQMQSLEARMSYSLSLMDPQCETWIFDLTDFPDANSFERLNAGQPGGINSGAIAATHYQIDMDGCTSDWSIYLQVPDGGDPLRKPQSNSPPPLLLRREMRNLETECPDGPLACVDYWIAELEPL